MFTPEQMERLDFAATKAQHLSTALANWTHAEDCSKYAHDECGPDETEPDGWSCTGGEIIAVHTAQEGVYATYGLMIGPNNVRINPPAEFFGRLRMVMLGLVTEDTQDTLV